MYVTSEFIKVGVCLMVIRFAGTLKSGKMIV
jgi:hypothetical protein